MVRLTIEQKIEALTNFLKVVIENKQLFIYSVNLGENAKFAVTEKLEVGINTKSRFMTYEEMNCYFSGVLDVKQKRVNF